jgi:hypothetical protein
MLDLRYLGRIARDQVLVSGAEALLRALRAPSAVTVFEAVDCGWCGAAVEIGLSPADEEAAGSIERAPGSVVGHHQMYLLGADQMYL